MITPEEESRLVEMAKRGLLVAYAPYSGIRVGAAILDRDGKIYVGCNVENASYGLSMCAERVCVFNAVSNGSTVFRALCLVVQGNLKPSPCGACRQVLAEFSGDLQLIMVNTAGFRWTASVEELLPQAFRLGHGAQEASTPKNSF
jgi:cytidine deaminase